LGTNDQGTAEALEEGLLVSSDVPDGLTNPYQRVRNSGTV